MLNVKVSFMILQSIKYSGKITCRLTHLPHLCSMEQGSPCEPRVLNDCALNISENQHAGSSLFRQIASHVLHGQQPSEMLKPRVCLIMLLLHEISVRLTTCVVFLFAFWVDSVQRAFLYDREFCLCFYLLKQISTTISCHYLIQLLLAKCYALEFSAVKKSWIEPYRIPCNAIVLFFQNLHIW